MGDYSSFYLYRKYEVTPDGLIPTDDYSIDGNGTMPSVVKNECDPECGCPPPEPIYRWVVVSGEFMCSGTTKMTQEKKQISYDSGATWVDVIPSETRPALPVIEYESEDCGYVPPTPTQYRWTQSGTTCIGYDKYQNNIKEQSTDGGTTWTVVIPEEYSASTLIETQSTDCGYIPIDGKFKLTLSDLSTVGAECDSTSAITSEVSTPYRTTLVSAEIGDCIISIGDYAFRNCSSLTSITIGDNVTSIGYCAFQNCSGLTSINIPDSVTSIGERAFIDCSGLTSIDIPSGVTSIGEYTFLRCKGLTSATIPDSVTSIGNSAFTYCRSLTSVTILATTPPSLGINPFQSTNSCPIYVPAASLANYKYRWTSYSGRIRAIP